MFIRHCEKHFQGRFMKKVLVFGTFDHLHPGHHFFLDQAAGLAPYLIAVVARDIFIEQTKGIRPSENEDIRLERVAQLDIVSRVVLSDNKPGSYGVLRREEPDIICLGHDQTDLRKNLKEWLTDNKIKIELSEAPPFRRDLYKSSLLRTIYKDA